MPSIDGKSNPDGDLAQITEAVRDYVEGWYTADPDRMRRCLHPNLAKRTVGHGRSSASWALGRATDGEMMVGFTREGGGQAVGQAGSTYDIVVENVFRRIASVRLISFEYMDYLHLAKFDDGWQIVNVLWQRRDGETELDP